MRLHGSFMGVALIPGQFFPLKLKAGFLGPALLWNFGAPYGAFGNSPSAKSFKPATA
jgi:hypothetical protein